MEYLALVQARLGSSRLPNKVLLELCGKPILQHVIERVSRSRFVNETAVVTSVSRENLAVVSFCANLGVRVFSGSENDVLDRFYQFAKLVKPQYIVRVTADCPCYDWNLLDMAIESMDECDYCYDATESLPDGLDIEILSFSALERSWTEAKMQSEREHVTLFIRNHPELFSIKSFECPTPGISHHRWTVDEPEDYELVKTVFEHFDGLGKYDFTYHDILGFLESRPDVVKLNTAFSRNEGLAKSLANDMEV